MGPFWYDNWLFDICLIEDNVLNEDSNWNTLSLIVKLIKKCSSFIEVSKEMQVKLTYFIYELQSSPEYNPYIIAPVFNFLNIINHLTADKNFVLLKLSKLQEK